MERDRQNLVFLDTHIVLWLYDARIEQFGETARRIINQSRVTVATIVRLELHYLREIGRLLATPDEVVRSLGRALGLSEDQDSPAHRVIDVAAAFGWTRDPFDRLIAAHAAYQEAPLITADKTILQHYAGALPPR